MSELERIAKKYNINSFVGAAALAQVPGFSDMIARAAEKDREAERINRLLESDRAVYNLTVEQQAALLATGNYRQFLLLITPKLNYGVDLSKLTE